MIFILDLAFGPSCPWPVARVFWVCDCGAAPSILRLFNRIFIILLKHETAAYLPVSLRQHHEVRLIRHAMGVMNSTPGLAGLAQESEGGRKMVALRTGLTRAS